MRARAGTHEKVLLPLSCSTSSLSITSTRAPGALQIGLFQQSWILE